VVALFYETTSKTDVPFIVSLCLKSNIMQRKIFKIKLVNREDSLEIAIDYTELSYKNIRRITADVLPFKIEADKECKLLFVGKENCKLELEDIYNLVALFQSIIGRTLVWDIIDKHLSSEDSQDLAGYLIM